MHQLRPNLERTKYLALVKQLGAEVGFTLAALKYKAKIVNVAGFRICHSLGWGRYLYVDDLVTDEKFRSSGAGHTMFSWLVQFARENRCPELRLDSRLERRKAHQFYLRERMEIECFNFRLLVAQPHRS